MPDDFAPLPRRAVPCVPRYRDVPAGTERFGRRLGQMIEKGIDVTGSVPVADGPREADEQPARDPDELFRIPDGWSKTIGGPVPEVVEHEPVVVTRFLDGTLEPTVAPPGNLVAELEQARQARDLLNRLRAKKKISMSFDAGTGAPTLIDNDLVVSRLVEHIVYDEEPLP